MALITGRIENPSKSLRRLPGEYHLSFSDIVHGLTIYECPRELPAEEEGNYHAVPETPHDRIRNRRSEDHPPTLSSLTSESVMMGWSDPVFRRQICRFPSPPWSQPVCTDGCIERELRGDGGWSIRLVANEASGWSVERRDPAGDVTGIIGWDGGETPGPGEVFFTNREGGISRKSSLNNPFLRITHSESRNTVYLVLPDELAGTLQQEAREQHSDAKGTRIAVLSAGAYQAEVEKPHCTSIYPRLQRIFRYSQAIKSQPVMGAGDILYTIRPDSRITTSVLVETSGTGIVFREISPGAEAGVQKSGVRGDEVLLSPILQQMIIPFVKLDSCEEWLTQAISPDLQDYLQEIRRYITTVFLTTTQPRDIAYEAKARAILTGFRQITGQIGKDTILRRGDILVRKSQGPGEPDLSKSVFVVRFMQEGTNNGHEGSGPVIRGYWLGEQNPVATSDLEKMCGEFGLMFIEGDDKCDRIIRQLAITCQDSSQPLKFSREGARSDPVVQLEFCGLAIEYHPSDRWLRVTIEGDEGVPFSIEETGYPSETAIVTEGTRELLRWEGMPVADIQYQSDAVRILVVLEDDFFSTLLAGNMIGSGQLKGQGGVVFAFLSMSDAEVCKILTARKIQNLPFFQRIYF